MAKHPLTPLGDRVVVQPLTGDDRKTESGIIIPETVSKEKPEQGTVVAVGPGRFNEDGTDRIPVSISVGDVVLFSKFTPDEVEIDGTEYLIIREDSILATVDQSKTKQTKKNTKKK